MTTVAGESRLRAVGCGAMVSVAAWVAGPTLDAMARDAAAAQTPGRAE